MKPTYSHVVNHDDDVLVTFIDSAGGVHFFTIGDMLAVVYNLERDDAPAVCRAVGLAQFDFHGVDAEYFFACWNNVLEDVSDSLDYPYAVWQDSEGNRMLVMFEGIIGASITAGQVILRGISCELKLSSQRADGIIDWFVAKGFLHPDSVLPSG